MTSRSVGWWHDKYGNGTGVLSRLWLSHFGPASIHSQFFVHIHYKDKFEFGACITTASRLSHDWFITYAWQAGWHVPCRVWALSCSSSSWQFQAVGLVDSSWTRKVDKLSTWLTNHLVSCDYHRWYHAFTRNTHCWESPDVTISVDYISRNFMSDNRLCCCGSDWTLSHAKPQLPLNVELLKLPSTIMTTIDNTSSDSCTLQGSCTPYRVGSPGIVKYK